LDVFDERLLLRPFGLRLDVEPFGPFPDAGEASERSEILERVAVLYRRLGIDIFWIVVHARSRRVRSGNVASRARVRCQRRILPVAQRGHQIDHGNYLTESTSWRRLRSCRGNARWQPNP